MSEVRTLSDDVTGERLPAPPSRVTAWSMTALLMVLFTINYGDKIVLGIVAQPLQQEFGLSASQIGLAGSAFFLAFTVGGFLAGLIDKWIAVRWSLVLLALAWAVSMLPMVFAASLAALLVTRILLGLAEGPATALIRTATYSWHPVEKRSLPSALLSSAASIASVLLAPLLAVLVAAFGWRAAFVAMTILGGLWCALWLLVWRDGPYTPPRQQRAEVMADAESPATQKVPWMRIFTTRTFIGSVCAVFAMYALVSATMTWLPSYFEVGLGYSRLQAGSMSSIPSLVGLAVMFAAGFLSDRLLGKKVSGRIVRGVLPGVSLLLCGLAMLSIPYIGSAALVVATISIGFAFGSTIIPMINAGISQICPPAQLAGTLGLYVALMYVGGTIAPYITGSIVDSAASAADGYALSFQVFGIVSAIGAILALLLIDPDRDGRKIREALHPDQRMPKPSGLQKATDTM